MNPLNTKILQGAASVALAVAMMVAPALALAQTESPASVVRQHQWTLRQRENWLHERINTSRNDGVLTRVQYVQANDALNGIRNREDDLRSQQNGQLTLSQTQMLEARLNQVSNRIHWANTTAENDPW